MIFDRFASCAALSTSCLSGKTMLPTRAPPSVRSAGRRFIAGEPMKPATKEFFGLSYRLRGVSTCWRKPPSLRIATRWPIVMASTWSWVT